MSVRVFQYIEKEGTGKHVDFPSAGLRLGKMIRTNIENWYEFTFLRGAHTTAYSANV